MLWYLGYARFQESFHAPAENMGLHILNASQGIYDTSQENIINPKNCLMLYLDFLFNRLT
jgi:hypothetical protein